jgi:hypothetical protein
MLTVSLFILCYYRSSEYFNHSEKIYLVTVFVMLYLYLLILINGDSTMTENDQTKKISEVQLIARHLNELLHDDACYRL